jgi:hypothetical protein
MKLFQLDVRSVLYPNEFTVLVISRFCSVELRPSESSCGHTQRTPTVWHSEMLLRENDGTPDLRETNE